MLPLTKNRFIYCLLILLLSIAGKDCFGQKEADNWYFGYEQAENFASGNPVQVNGSAMSANYGSTSLSDSLGNLLFYSDGQKIYNRNNLLMPHGDGLLSSSYATSPCVAFRKPGSLKNYYLFTIVGAPTTKWQPSLNYSIIDMSLDGGLGDIVGFQKNIPLLAADSAYQTIGAVRHGSRDAYWVFVRNHGSANKFYAFLVDAMGVNPTPVVSSCMLKFNVVANGQSEIIKISPDGKYLLYLARNGASGHYGKVELYSIDNVTGQLTQVLLFDTGTMNNGAEFSANSEYLYMSNTIWDQLLVKYRIKISQYDLKKVNDVTQFQNSAYSMVQDTLENFYGNLLLANNGKIYFIQPYGSLASPQSFLGVINYPYLPGASCNLQLNYLALPYFTMEGLPTFVSSFAALFDWTGNCVADSVSFHSHFYPLPNSFAWNFGDPTSGTANTSTLANPKHIYYSPGEYTVLVTAVFPNGTAETATRKITISTGPSIEIGDTIYVCKGDSVPLTPGSGYTEYLWSTGANTSTIYAKDPGVYWVQVKNQGDCASIDSVRILNYPEMLFEDDSVVVSPTTCGGLSGAISGLKISGSPPLTLTWTDKISGQVLGHSPALYNLGVGIYELTATDDNGCSLPAVSYVIKDVGDIMIDTVTYKPADCNINNGQINIIAVSGLGSRIQYFVKGGNDTLTQWHDGVFDSLATGTYYVWVTDSSGCKSVYPKAIQITNPTGPSVTGTIVIPATYLQTDGKIMITANSSSDTLYYSINGSTPKVNDGNFINLAAGTYTCTVMDEKGCDTSFVVEILEINSIKINAIAGDGSTCLGNIAVLPLQANNFDYVSAFNTRLVYDKSLVICQNYLNANPLLSDSIKVDLFPAQGELVVKWNGKNPVSLADGNTLLELSFASLTSGQSAVLWDISPGICVFTDSLGNNVAAEFTQGQVRVYSIPKAEVPEPLPTCEGGDILLIANYQVGTGNGTIGYTWTGPGGFTSNDPLVSLSTLTQAEAGQYNVSLNDTNHCQSDYTVEVNVIPTPVAGFTADTIYFDEQIQLEAEKGYDKYSWNTGDSTYYVLVSAEGWYKVTIATTEGCTTTDSVMMLYAFVPLTMPNAFTPDGDGLNDVFRPVTLPEKISSFSMHIYDRWGKQVFFTNDVKFGWDGNINGSPAQIGGYAYVLKYGNPSGAVREKRGMVTLVR